MSESVIIYAANKLSIIRSYDQHALLKPFTVTIKSGEWVSLIGHNGSGKSTLAHIISGLQRTGIELRGEEWLRGDTAFPIITQMTSDYLLGATAYEDLIISYEQYGRPMDHNKLESKIDELLHALQLYPLKHVPLVQLSGGERQLVAFAGALLMESACIILDEITSMLSETNKWRVSSMIRRLAKEKGVAVLWITQQLDELEADDTVWVMCELGVVYQGTASELYSRSNSEIDTPSTSVAAQLGLAIPWSVGKSFELGLPAEQLQFNPYGLARAVKQRHVVTV